MIRKHKVESNFSVLFQVSTSEPPSPPPVPVTLTISPPPDGAALYSPPPPYEPSTEQDTIAGKEFTRYVCLEFSVRKTFSYGCNAWFKTFQHIKYFPSSQIMLT